MQREDVERLEADLLRLAYECDEQGEGWQEDGPLIREAATALRALLAERDAAFSAGQDAERERCWTLAMDAYEVWWRRSVATAYDPLRELADKIGRTAKPRP